MSWDVLVLGAGMAGLGCARRLAEAGLRVCVVEARDAVGGRIRTEWVNGAPVELGAEFVHGRPQVLLQLIREAGLTVEERRGTTATFVDGGLQTEQEDADEEMEGEDARFAPLEELRGATGPDESFAAWLRHSRWAADAEACAGSLAYVEGFNAAEAEEISARSLGVQQEAEDAMDGDRIWHVREGYSRVPEFLAGRVRLAGGEVRCGTPVKAVHWATGRAAFALEEGELAAPRAVLTLPLGMLQAGALRIVPEPVTITESARLLRMGEVFRVSLVFRRAWWAEVSRGRSLRALSFLFDQGELPAVWWTAHPEPEAVLTGWAGGPRARRLLELPEAEMAERMTRQVARLFGVPEARVRDEMVACRTHNWSADPWSRGAYSYVGVGGLGAAGRMSEPVEHTLYFAGEHTVGDGHWATVHGALASGKRAAEQVLASLR